MTVSRRIAEIVAAFANLHPVAREALTEWFDADEESREGK